MLVTRAVPMLGLIAAFVTSVLATQDDSLVIQGLQDRAIAALQAAEESGNSLSSCKLKNAIVRRDWEAFQESERKDYISAVKCLLERESVLTEHGWVKLPGRRHTAYHVASKTRFDDFAGVHINLTFSVHGTASFLGFHRYLVWTWEKALREGCGYSGHQPYWNWFKYQDDLTKSPVFDGSDTSMSGDGTFVAHNGSMASARTVHLPSGNGGGCLKDGPFKNMTVNLGPIRPGMDGMPNVTSVFDYNPRCLRRDLTVASSAVLTVESLLNVTVGDASRTIGLFQDELQTRNSTPGFQGMHGAGHYAMGGDGADLFSSINDPAFWHHHTMLDRVWWMWQALHPEQAKTIEGTLTLDNDPPTRNATLEDTVTTMGLSPDIKLSETLDTLSGPFCYVYA